MDSEEQAYIRSVVADPDSDQPRLDYADWLERHGRGDRAKLIRLQCEIEQLHGEESRLLERHSLEWGGELYANGASGWTFHRGFPEEISISVADFLRHHSELNAATPLRKLHLADGRDANLLKLADLPVMGQVRSLEIDRASESSDVAGRYGPDGVQALVDSKHLAKLQSLGLHSHRIGEADALRLARTSNLGSLTHLTLTGPNFDGAGHRFLLEIVNAPNLRRIQQLQLGSQVYRPQALQYLRTADPASDVAR